MFFKIYTSRKKYRSPVLPGLALSLLVTLVAALSSEFATLFAARSDKTPANKPARGLKYNAARLWRPALKRAPRAGEEYVYKDGSVLVWIPGGSFTMGAKAGQADEKPSHKITVRGFWLGKYEITNEQYMRFVKEKDWWAPDFSDDEELNGYNQPVVGIKWNHARKYLNWANVRLPTEAEWEYVARGGRNFKYPTATGKLNHNLANFWGTGGRDKWLEKTSPVGSFPPNPFGIYDLAGNAFEWTSSLYRSYPYSQTDGRENQTTKSFRVMRGGSWHFSEKYCRAGYRHKFRMHLRLDFAGFRVARDRVPGQRSSY